VEQMIQGNGFIVEGGIFKDTGSLAPETRATIVSKIHTEKRVMFRICADKLNNVIGNIDITGEFGLWMTENETITIQLPNLVQLSYDNDLEDPYPTLGLRIASIGTQIRDGLKNLIEDYINDNRTTCSCTDLPHLLLIIDDLEITYLSINSKGNVDCMGAPQILGRHTDLRQVLKLHAMNRAVANVN
jgi:hypothetical protein